MRKLLLFCAILFTALFSIAWAQQSTQGLVAIEGVYYDRGAETLDLTGVRITRPEKLKGALGSMPYLTRVDLTDCGLDNEALAQLREELAPQGVKVVWTLYLGKSGYSLRYATELRALDLGHNWISDVSFLEPMTELRVLILSDNRFGDLSCLKGKPLEYIEIFNTKVQDLSFLEGCDTLLDLNICMTRVYDLSPLYHLKNLKRIWVGNATGVTWTERQRFLSCQKDNLEAYEFWTDIPTLYGWRGDENGPGHPRYEIIKAMFKENVYYDFNTVLRPEQYVYLYTKKRSGKGEQGE